GLGDLPAEHLGRDLRRLRRLRALDVARQHRWAFHRLCARVLTLDAHERTLPLTSSISVLMLFSVSCGTGGVARCNRPRPSNAINQAITKTPPATMSAAAHPGNPSEIPRIAAATSAPKPNQAITPPLPRRPAPSPACLPLLASSILASAISSRT